MPETSDPTPRATISFTIDLVPNWAEYYDMVGEGAEQIGQRIAEDIVERVFEGDDTITPCVQVWSPSAVAISQ